ncbi:MAG: hypothetical protein MZW92_77390 [Comamonadaceae bacterium]|nr:hypothetical protein [Comamonadaceae bacterium]
MIGQVTRVFPLHGEVDADHRQGPGDPGAGGAQRPARGRCSAPAAARWSCASCRPTPTSRTATCWSPPASTASILPGLPVATVARIERDDGLCLCPHRRARRSAGVEQHGQVLVLAPARGTPPPPEDARQPEKPAVKAKRVKRKRGAEPCNRSTVRSRILLPVRAGFIVLSSGRWRCSSNLLPTGALAGRARLGGTGARLLVRARAAARSAWAPPSLLGLLMDVAAGRG